ncbi:MAG: RNA-binding S4 domain-containing protein [Deltaproteobacteria bacterium]
MRLDKFLKVSRIIKRRTIANEMCDAGKVKMNDKVAKASSEVKVGDIIEMRFGASVTRFEVLNVIEHVRKDEAKEMFKIIDG